MPLRSPKPAKSSPASSTGSSESSTDQFPVKKRKPTYLVRKDEEVALREEILQLEAQLAVLKTQGLPTAAALAADPTFQQAQVKTKVLTDMVRSQQLSIASTQSLMSESLRAQHLHPLHSRIHLKKQWSERRETLMSLREEKLRNAYEYVTACSQHFPESQIQGSMEHFETEEGDICSTEVVALRFPGVKSLEQVFDAFRFYLSNMEICISERLGHITVREDYDIVEGEAYNARIVSNDASGLTTESNSVVFTQLFDKGQFGGEPCAILASDCVDEDDLYPYQSSERIRKDISGAILLTAHRQRKHGKDATTTKCTSDDNSELVVTMRRGALLKLHHPEFEVSPVALQELGTGIAQWGDVMVKAVREILYATR